jgi:hypothetical protein
MNRHLFHGLNARLNKSSNVYTVGQNNCNYTSLVTGSLPFLQFYNNSKWISLENNFLATIDMSGLYFHHLIIFSSSGTGPLVLDSIISNLMVSNSWFSPEHTDTGLYNIQIFTDQGLVPLYDKRILSLQGISSNRILICNRDLEPYYVNINSLDFNGVHTETCSGSIECKIPFYFENL